MKTAFSVPSAKRISDIGSLNYRNAVRSVVYSATDDALDLGDEDLRRRQGITLPPCLLLSWPISRIELRRLDVSGRVL